MKNIRAEIACLVATTCTMLAASAVVAADQSWNKSTSGAVGALERLQASRVATQEREAKAVAYAKSLRTALVPGEGAFIEIPGVRETRWMTPGDTYKNIKVYAIGQINSHIATIIDGKTVDLEATYVLPGMWCTDTQKIIAKQIDDQHPYVDGQVVFVVDADGGVERNFENSACYTSVRQAAPFPVMPEKIKSAVVKASMGPHHKTEVKIVSLVFQ